MKLKLQGAIFDVCKIQFPSKAQKLKHRRLAHKCERHNQVDLDALIKLEEHERLKNIEFIQRSNPNTKEYFALFKDGSRDWITIVSDANPHVVSFRKKKSLHMELYSPNGDWMKPIWDIDD